MEIHIEIKTNYRLIFQLTIVYLIALGVSF